MEQILENILSKNPTQLMTEQQINALSKVEYNKCDYCEIIIRNFMEEYIKKYYNDIQNGMFPAMDLDFRQIAKLVKNEMSEKTAIRHTHDLIDDNYLIEALMLKIGKNKYKIERDSLSFVNPEKRTKDEYHRVNSLIKQSFADPRKKRYISINWGKILLISGILKP